MKKKVILRLRKVFRDREKTREKVSLRMRKGVRKAQTEKGNLNKDRK